MGVAKSLFCIFTGWSFIDTVLYSGVQYVDVQHFTCYLLCRAGAGSCWDVGAMRTTCLFSLFFLLVILHKNFPFAGSKPPKPCATLDDRQCLWEAQDRALFGCLRNTGTLELWNSGNKGW